MSEKLLKWANRIKICFATFRSCHSNPKADHCSDDEKNDTATGVRDILLTFEVM